MRPHAPLIRARSQAPYLDPEKSDYAILGVNHKQRRYGNQENSGGN